MFLLPFPQKVPRRCTAALVFGLMVPCLASATLLRFDQAYDGTVVGPVVSGGSLPPDYGDHARAGVVAVPGGAFTYDQQGEGFTPDVIVEVFATGATAADPRVRLWGDGYGSLRNVLFGEGPGVGGAAELFVRLSAAPGFEVDLYGFDLAAFGGVDLTVRAIEVWDGASRVHLQNDTLVEGDADAGGFTAIAFAGALSAPELLVRLDLGNLPASIRDNIGLDNLRFGQTPPPAVQAVPEPPLPWVLATAALAASLWHRGGRARQRRRG